MKCYCVLQLAVEITTTLINHVSFQDNNILKVHPHSREAREFYMTTVHTHTFSPTTLGYLYQDWAAVAVAACLEREITASVC